MTVRVGCSLGYRATGDATLLLNLRPQTHAAHAVIFEALTIGDELPTESFGDSHGNHMLRGRLSPGEHFLRYDAIVAVTSQPDDQGAHASSSSPAAHLPPEVLRYAFPSRYADSDKLVNFAWQHFGHIADGYPRVRAISQWIHENIEYRYGSGVTEMSAWDVLRRGHGVCRDFAHLAIALNRTFNVPARYVTGHMPDIGFPDPENHMDFHAYAEVYLGDRWYTTDARFHVPRIGRIKVSCGLDAVDGAFSTIFGGANLSYFQVWAYQVKHGTVGVGDPLDFTQRLDNQTTIVTEAPYFVPER
ncbi:transglutaminase-like domain-containing protein [Synoicihabitans lomoniglobus]|uniref:Transglutaminase family protein n=1 Tax=Synoicihabitans lomoniglobus TaxID=2909285 RepID=A0AAF0CMB2_9BACT|nr:transglutaminase family protein [Opitutaceae bacterium LMO-M01]WED63051.1 transglutaminase family protein [Opitutaceae bacterium LMO-M01]